MLTQIKVNQFSYFKFIQILWCYKEKSLILYF